MKIAFFTDSFKPNNDGVATVTDMITKELVKRGHKITIVCPADNTEVVKENNLKIIRISSHSIHLYKEHKICFKTPEYLEQLEDFSDYDLIHMQTNITIPSLGYLVALKYNIPVSCTFHTNIADFAASFFKGKVLGEVKNPIYNLISNNKLILSFGKWITENVVWNLTRDFHNAIPTTSVPSHYCKALLRSKGVTNPILVISNPLMPENSTQDYFSKYPIKDKFVLLHVGRLSVEKRENILIEAVALLKDKIPNLKLIICSDGPLRKQFENLVKKKRLENIVTFTGFIPRDELNFLYEQSKIVFGLGLFETFNICVAEALYYSKPLIVSDSGPHSELIDKNGFLVPVSDNEVKLIAEHILELYNDENKYISFSRQSKNLWKQFDYNSTMDTFEKYLVNSVKKNKIMMKNYMSYIRYISSLSISINTLIFSLSLRFKQFEKLQKKMDSFLKSLADGASRFKKNF